MQLFEEITQSINQIDEESMKSFAKLSSLLGLYHVWGNIFGHILKNLILDFLFMFWVYLESECNQISICMDLKTAIALARCGADPRLFVAPKIISKDNKVSNQ